MRLLKIWLVAIISRISVPSTYNNIHIWKWIRRMWRHAVIDINIAIVKMLFILFGFLLIWFILLVLFVFLVLFIFFIRFVLLIVLVLFIFLAVFVSLVFFAKRVHWVMQQDSIRQHGPGMSTSTCYTTCYSSPCHGFCSCTYTSIDT
jgi:fatty acid desaturase